MFTVRSMPVAAGKTAQENRAEGLAAGKNGSFSMAKRGFPQEWSWSFQITSQH